MLIGHSLAVRLFTQLTANDTLAGGYIFFGQVGVGKRTFAESFARFLEGHDFEPSSQILQDTLIIEPHGESIGIETARKIKSYLSETPILSKRRTVIIDQAHALTLQAENALLKVSEETPPYSLIILITPNPESLLETLVSRFQKIYFAPVPQKEMVRLLPKKIELKRGEDLITLSGGSPGRLLGLMNEEGKMIESYIQKLLSAPMENRKKMVKEYLDEEKSPLALIDAILLHAFNQSTKQTGLILKALRAKRDLSTLNLNPRLQLENIFS